MAAHSGPNIVESGLVLSLDAANIKSYPGSGTTWFDLSGGNRNFSIDSSFATWNNQGFFSVTSKVGNVFTGPASNSFGFSSTNEHTVISWVEWTTQTTSIYFNWSASPTVGSDVRAIFTHFPYTGINFYYDVSGCCSATQRISSSTGSNNFQNNVNMATWRTRTNQTPNRQFFENLTEKVNSGTNSTSTVNWNLTNPVGLCNTWNGKIYNIYVYNRSLTDAEIQQNFNALRVKFRI